MPEDTPPDELAAARAWFARRTYAASANAADELTKLKAGRRVSVILPARDEEPTIGAIIETIRTRLVETSGMVDEIVVIDSRSTDRTAEVAFAAGAIVHPVGDEALADGGKGAAMQAGVHHMSGDLGVFLDADVVDFGVDFVLALLAPMLRDPDLVLVKGFYDRPWNGSAGGDSTPRPTGGGRVTELVARPLIHRRSPALSAFAQPLSGECAFRRDALFPLPFVSGYGVEIGILLQLLEHHGLDAMAQADLGVRLHRHQELDALGRMALQVAAAFDLCLDGRDEVVDTRTLIRRRADGALGLAQEDVTTRLLPSALGRMDREDPRGEA